MAYMPSTLRQWCTIGLLALSAKPTNGEGFYHYPNHGASSHDTTTCETHSNDVTTVPYTTVSTQLYPTTIIPKPTTVTVIEETVIYNSTVYYPTVIPTTVVVKTTVVTPTTIPTTVPTTVPTTIPTTISVFETITYNSTVYYSAIVTTTIVVPTTLSTTVPTTITTTTPTTITVEEPECPTTCSIEAGTVQLFFWPTDNDYTYPSTYVHTALDYTFTSPSVYLVIDTIYGTNSLGTAGPSATSKVFGVDLDEVSTILPMGQVTRQLTLNDLYTACPQSIAPEIIATTIPDGHCDFSLLAPETVKQWASPCNACGRIGLFDPPYAIPTLSGGLVETTVTTTEVETTAVTTETTVTETGVIPSTTGPVVVPTGSARKVTCMCGASWLLMSCFMIFWL